MCLVVLAQWQSTGSSSQVSWVWFQMTMTWLLVIPSVMWNHAMYYLGHRVQTITTTQKVPQYGDVCSLQKIWRKPRTVKETTSGLDFFIVLWVRHHTVGDFQQRKHPQILRFCGYLQNVFSAKILGMASFGGTSEQSMKVFSLESFPLYCSTHTQMNTMWQHIISTCIHSKVESTACIWWSCFCTTTIVLKFGTSLIESSLEFWCSFDDVSMIIGLRYQDCHNTWTTPKTKVPRSYSLHLEHHVQWGRYDVFQHVTTW